MTRKALILPLLLLLLGAGREPAARTDRSFPLEKVRLPPGFSIEVYAESVPNARQMALGEKRTLFAGSRREGKVYAITDADGDHRADRVRVIARGLNMPSGIAFRDGSLYVAEIHRLLRFDRIEERLDNPPEPVVLREYPSDKHHGWKFIAFGPDGKLYVPVGMPCNVCEPPAPIYGTLTRLNPDGTGFEIFARGIRNTVGFDWQPGTETLWFTDNGRDWMGDNLPPDELNRAPEAGMHFGFPYRHGKALPDPEFGDQAPPGLPLTPAALELGPHVAALGMRFYNGRMFPPEYRGRIFIAEHGSWNRSTPIGYRIMTARVEGEAATDYEVFAEGWLAEGGVWGRPADVLVLPDGSLLIADDHAGAIYRVTYRGAR